MFVTLRSQILLRYIRHFLNTTFKSNINKYISITKLFIQSLNHVFMTPRSLVEELTNSSCKQYI